MEVSLKSHPKTLLFMIYCEITPNSLSFTKGEEARNYEILYSFTR